MAEEKIKRKDSLVVIYAVLDNSRKGYSILSSVELWWSVRSGTGYR